jgi:chromosome segregation ATPase
MTSVERSASLSGVGMDFAMRLELATERQKRQLAEDKLRQMEEKLTLQQSGTTLLAVAVSERQAADEECETLRRCVDELRQDNETLASMVEQLSADCKNSEKFAADTISERDQKQREYTSLRSELQEVRASRQKLEDRLRDDSQQLSLLASALGEKDATLADLQEHFKSITEKLRAAHDEQAVAASKNDQLANTVQELRHQIVGLKNTQELLIVTHHETARRFATMLMKEEGSQELLYQQWSECVKEWIPALENDISMVDRAWGDTKEQLDHSQAALEVSIAEAQRRRGMPRATQTSMTAMDINETERERDEAIKTLQYVTESKKALEEDCRSLQIEVEARKDALNRLHARRKTPSIHTAATSVTSATASPPRQHSDGQHVDAADQLQTVDSMYHRGEALVMKQRLEAMMQRMLGQTEEYELAMKENERLKEEIGTLRVQPRVSERWNTASTQSVSNTALTNERPDENAQFSKHASLMLEALEKRVDLAERQLLDAKQRIHEVEGERDRALREVADMKRHVASLKSDITSYQVSMDELQSYSRGLESTRIPRDIHQQELSCANSAAADAISRVETLQPQLAAERKRRVELEDEVSQLRSLQLLAQLQETNNKVEHENDELRRAIEELRVRMTNKFEAELEQRDLMVADAAKRLMEASDELDMVEFEKQSLRRECNALRSRIDAMLTLQERTTRTMI